VSTVEEVVTAGGRPRAPPWRLPLVRLLERIWFGNGFTSFLLQPLAWGFRLGVGLRHLAYRRGWCRVQRIAAPVIVVGNLTLGGTGKTPLVLWLARFLVEQGYRPGIVCRGYGARARTWPQQVRGDSDPSSVGDEALVLVRRSGCPVVADPNRVRAARALVEHYGCDLVLSDDGLQHLALGRDVEIVVVDGERRFGNGRCLPAGPLREPPARLHRADLVVAHGKSQVGEFSMRYWPQQLHSCTVPGRSMPLRALAGQRVHAVAGVGVPERFFAMLRRAGLRVTEHAFPDHHPYRPRDLCFDDDMPLVMTEKDMVKCVPYAKSHWWYLGIEARVHEALGQRLLRLLRERGHG